MSRTFYSESGNSCSRSGKVRRREQVKRRYGALSPPRARATIDRMATTICGGVSIGLAAGLLFLLEGRIAGVSGMLARGLDPTEGERGWRIAFLVGLVAGGGLAAAFLPGALPGISTVPTWRILAAGTLVGIGARVANGCTSGHGLCGVARGSRRSVAAVATFMAAGMLTVLVLGGGAR
jgi:uncharacterized membrane protein YedE/YeeE